VWSRRWCATSTTPPPGPTSSTCYAAWAPTTPRAITRTGEKLYKDLGLREVDADVLLDALAANPVLIERPIAVLGDRAVVARPPEKVLELLDQA
jgi:arsenate reductase